MRRDEGDLGGLVIRTAWIAEQAVPRGSEVVNTDWYGQARLLL